MSGSTMKLHYLEYICKIFLEPNDIVEYFPDTSVFSAVGENISSIPTIGDNARKTRVTIFLEWLYKDDENYQGNKYQEFVDVLNKDDLNYKWLVPLLTDCESFDVERSFLYLKKPDKIKKILQVIFPALENINVQEMLKYLRRDLSADDRNEIENITTRRHGLYALLNKLIYKHPSWMRNFIEAVRALNYNACSPMLKDTGYDTLASALEDYFDCFDDNVESVEMTVEEEVEVMNERMAVLQPGVGHPDATPYSSKRRKESEDCQSKSPDEMKKSSVSLLSPESVTQGVKPQTDKYELRSYQKELSKLALQGTNVIICERTGSGKTRVAGHIIGEHLKGNVTKIGQCQGPKVVFFTPTGGLAEQQCEKMKTYLPEMKRIDMLRGNLDDQLEKNFQKRIYSSDIIVMTPQILLNCLKEKSVQSIFDFSMMVFDECHYARSSHPYVEILKKYLEERKNKERDIQIIGLTATLGVGDSSNLDEAKKHIFKLLGIMNAEDGIVYVRDSDNEDELHNECPIAAEESMKVDTADEDSFRKLIRETIEKIVAVAEKIGVFRACNMQLPGCELDKKFETWCCKLRHASGNFCEENSTIGRDARSCAEALQCLYNGYTLCHSCHCTDAIAKIEDFVNKQYVNQKEKNTESENNLHKLMDDALKDLTDCVDKTKNETLDIMKAKILDKCVEHVEFRCMVMVSRRYFASCVKNWLSDDLELKHLKPRVYIGVGNKSSSDCPGMSHPAQKETLEKFAKGESQILVCTPDAAGVGIDIPDCNLVITIDCVKNEISKTQLAGRVRAKTGEVLHIYLGNNYLRDKLTGEKLQLMDRAKRGIYRMSLRNPGDYRNELLRGQTGALKDFADNALKRNGVGLIRNDVRSLLCRKCGEFICKTDELIRLNGNHHTVNRPDFKEKYSAIPHEQRGRKCGETSMTHVNKISCKQCKHVWGNEVKWKVYLIPVIKIKGFKIKEDDGKIFQPSQWKSTRLKIHERSRDKSLCDSLFAKCEENKENTTDCA